VLLRETRHQGSTPSPPPRAPALKAGWGRRTRPWRRWWQGFRPLQSRRSWPAGSGSRRGRCLELQGLPAAAASSPLLADSTGDPAELWVQRERDISLPWHGSSFLQVFFLPLTASLSQKPCRRRAMHAARWGLHRPVPAPAVPAGGAWVCGPVASTKPGAATAPWHRLGTLGLRSLVWERWLWSGLGLPPRSPAQPSQALRSLGLH